MFQKIYLENNQIKHETEILKLASTGDQDAFALLFKHYSKVIYPFALKLTRSEDLAEEILQEVFLKIWIGRTRLAEVENFGGYLNRITRNHSYNVLQRLSHEAEITQKLSKQLSEEVNNTNEEIDLKDIEQSLKVAIDHLTPQQRQVYRLCHQEGLKYSEAASRLNISSSTVHTHMKHALQSIRTYILRISALLLVVHFIFR